MLADGWSLDDQRKPLLDLEKLGVTTKQKLTAAEHEKNNLPDILARWQQREGGERNNPKTAQSFAVDKADLIANDYDLSLNRYKEVVHEHVEHIAPLQLIAELKQLESEIQAGLTGLEGMLK